MIALIVFSHKMKLLLRPCLGLSHLGKSYIIDLIFFLGLTVWSVPDFRDILSERIGTPMVPLSSCGLMADGNMANISPTIPINISRYLGKIENVYIGEKCSHAEIQKYTKLF